MPAGDSPPPFAIRFASQKPGEVLGAVEPAEQLYHRALELTALVAQLAENLEVARFHVRDRLDRDATQLALLCRRAASERAPTERRRAYREAKPYAQECAALLDIIGLRQHRSGRDPRLVDEARALVGEVIAALGPLAAR
jgi:hypothetical protein